MKKTAFFIRRDMDVSFISAGKRSGNLQSRLGSSYYLICCFDQLDTIFTCL
jgi:hypothetical protein